MSVTWIEEKERWRFEFNRVLDGERHRFTKLLPQGWSRSRAEAFDAKETSRRYARASGLERPPALIAEAVDRYVGEVCPKLKNGKKAAQDLAQLLDAIDGKTFPQLAQVGIDYEAAHTHLAPATVRNRLAYLRAAVRYAFDRHSIGDADSISRFKVPTVQNYRTNRGTIAEYDTIVDQLGVDRETAALVTLTRYTALRWRSEILKLQRTDITKARGTTFVQCGTSKNGEPHMVPVHPKALWALAFIPFTRSSTTYYRKFKAAVRRAGRPDLVMQDARRSWASDILSGGKTLDDVQVGLNHKSKQASERYAWMDSKRKESLFLGRNLHTSPAPRRAQRPKKAA